MIRSSQPLFEEGADFAPTPLEDILRPVSAFMSDPLDVPDDRFVSLEDMLYAAGSAFARPSPELEEYYVTARKREADAIAKTDAEDKENEDPPAIPESVAKQADITPPQPEAIADMQDFGYEFPNYGKALEAQDPGSIPPIKADPIANPDKYKKEKQAREDAIAANKHKLQTPVPSNLMGKMGRQFGTEEEAVEALVDNVQQLTLSDTERDKQEYGAVIRKRTNPDGSVSYYHDQIYRGSGGSSVSMGIQTIKGTNKLAGDPIVAVFHTHPPMALSHKSHKMWSDHELIDSENGTSFARNDQLNQQLSPGDRGNGNAFDANNQSMLAQIQRLSNNAGHTNSINAYLARPDGQIRKWSGNWSGAGTQVMPDYNFNYTKGPR